MKLDTLTLYVIGGLVWLGLGIGVLNWLGAVIQAALRSIGG
jgi:hypothetical protein